jgi:hypothetical protein
VNTSDDDLTPEEEAELERLEALQAKRQRQRSRQAPPRAPGGVPAAAERRQNQDRWVILFVVAVLILLALVINSVEDADDDGGGGGDDARVRELTAFNVCKDFVSQRLKSPGSAKFRNFFEEDGEVIVSGIGNGPYQVISTVDSQNGFGALIRSRFSCTVTLDRAADTWRLSDLDLEG